MQNGNSPQCKPSDDTTNEETIHDSKPVNVSITIKSWSTQKNNYYRYFFKKIEITNSFLHV